MKLHRLLIMVSIPVLCAFGDGSTGGFEGKEQTVDFYSTAGDTKESFKTIWYCSGIAVYRTQEVENFNSHKIVFNSQPFTDVCTAETEQMLAMLGVQTGLYHGQYYPIRSKKLPENIQNTYMAFIGIPLTVFDVKVDFMGTARKYKFSYPLKPDKADRSKVAFFRIPSGNYNYEEDYRISADVTQERVSIRAIYNKQVLVLTLTPHQSQILAQMSKWGLAKKPLINIQDSTAKLIEEPVNP